MKREEAERLAKEIAENGFKQIQFMVYPLMHDVVKDAIHSLVFAGLRAGRESMREEAAGAADAQGKFDSWEDEDLASSLDRAEAAVARGIAVAIRALTVFEGEESK